MTLVLSILYLLEFLHFVVLFFILKELTLILQSTTIFLNFRSEFKILLPLGTFVSDTASMALLSVGVPVSTLKNVCSAEIFFSLIHPDPSD